MGKTYKDFAMNFEIAKDIYAMVNGTMVQNVCGPDGDLSSGILHDFANYEQAFDDALKGATGTQLKNYINQCKRLIAGWVLDLRVWAQDARDGLQLEVNQEVENANKLQHQTDDKWNEAQSAYDLAQGIETELDTSAFNKANGYFGN